MQITVDYRLTDIYPHLMDIYPHLTNRAIANLLQLDIKIIKLIVVHKAKDNQTNCSTQGVHNQNEGLICPLLRSLP